MKRHGDLWGDVIDIKNIRLAHKNAKKGKKNYNGVQMVEEDREYYLEKVQQMLKNKSFTTADYKTFKVFEPKEREIFKLPYYPDRIVHHAVMNVMQPIWDKIFIYDVYSAIPGKGIHAAIERLDKFLRNKEETKYCLQFDIASFYPSVDHDILMNLIKRKIKDSDLLWLLDDIVHSPAGDKGIPIGNYTSQYFANIYLNWFDHFVKHNLKEKYYIRYADDGIILNKDKGRLHQVWRYIEEYLDEKLNLELNPKTQIYPVDDRGIDFLGYRTFRDKTLLRKRTAKKFKRKIREIRENYEELKPDEIVSSIMSYVGWIKHCNGFNLIKKYILRDEEVIRAMNKSCKELNINNPLTDLTEMLHSNRL